MFRDAVVLINGLVDDLAASRAEGAAEYANDPEFRNLVDRITRSE